MKDVDVKSVVGFWVLTGDYSGKRGGDLKTEKDETMLNIARNERNLMMWGLWFVIM